jgi:hypothetical protein
MNPPVREQSYTLLHVRHPAYTAGVATGVIVTGPTDDGFVHLHFFRESQRILDEVVPTLASTDEQLKLDRANAQLKVHLQREEVATISLPERVFGDIVKGLTEVAQNLLTAHQASQRKG